ncbi:MAG: hypothetical protein AAF411_20795 [Myxococcota bacterium]
MVTKSTVYIDMDGVLCEFERAKRQHPDVEFPQSLPGFYKNLRPVRGAIDAVRELARLADVWILTAPSVYNPLSYTEKRLWVEKHLGFDMCHRLILSPDKSLLRGDVLVDDRADSHRQDRFEGRLILFRNWRDALAKVKSLL